MTFEEFFAKKKIDLLKIKQADTTLFEKLKNEYELMGPKSFDHSKKFLFNDWRRNFRTTD
jgi:hypothetical protein